MLLIINHNMYIIVSNATGKYLLAVNLGWSEWTKTRNNSILFESLAHIRKYIVENCWSSEIAYDEFINAYIKIIFLHPLNCKNNLHKI